MDSYIPMRKLKPKKENKNKKKIPTTSNTTTTSINGLHLIPAYAQIKDYQIWVAMIEKAYAKAHGR